MKADQTVRFAKVSKSKAYPSGISVRDENTVRCDITVLKTLPVHRAAEIQHDIKKYFVSGIKKLGSVPKGNLCYLPVIEQTATPIYLITVINPNEGRIAYVGKAASATNRFKGGHAAFLKLLDPKYDHYMKFISFAIISVATSVGELIPVEWIASSSLRKKIISHVEHALIWKFQPELNTGTKRTQPKGYGFEMNFQDSSADYLNMASIRVRAKGKAIVQQVPELRITT